MNPSSTSGSIVYVENFPQTRPVQDLQTLFEPFGPIIEISLPPPSEYEKNKQRQQNHPNIQNKVTNDQNQQKNQNVQGKKRKKKGKNTPSGQNAQNVQNTSKKNVSQENVKVNRGFGFVSFEEIEDASHAIQNMDQAEFYGQILRVTWATRRHLEGGIPVLEQVSSAESMEEG